MLKGDLLLSNLQICQTQVAMETTFAFMGALGHNRGVAGPSSPGFPRHQAMLQGSAGQPDSNPAHGQLTRCTMKSPPNQEKQAAEAATWRQRKAPTAAYPRPNSPRSSTTTAESLNLVLTSRLRNMIAHNESSGPVSPIQTAGSLLQSLDRPVAWIGGRAGAHARAVNALASLQRTLQ